MEERRRSEVYCESGAEAGPVMSIYATLWRLQFPRYGDDHTGCEWVGILAQGVPAHIGTPTPGYGYEKEDPYASFLPPAVEASPDEENLSLRAVVIVAEGTPKGTERSAQEYVHPLLTLTGEEYASLSFGELHERICNALRGGQQASSALFRLQENQSPSVRSYTDRGFHDDCRGEQSSR